MWVSVHECCTQRAIDRSNLMFFMFYMSLYFPEHSRVNGCVAAVFVFNLRTWLKGYGIHPYGHSSCTIVVDVALGTKAS